MNNLKELNYQLVEEKEGVKIWLSEEVRMCIIEMDYYSNKTYEKLTYDWILKYNWIEKGTIVIFKDSDKSIRETELSHFMALKRHINSDFKIPKAEKKDYKLTLRRGNDGDFNLDPQKELDTDFSASFYEFLGQMNKDSIVTYPPICETAIELRWMRYVAGKFLNSNVE